jgi:hypothetical protein
MKSYHIYLLSSSVSLVPRLRSRRPEFPSRQCTIFFFWGRIHPHEYRVSSSGVKWSGREANPFTPCRADVKNSWSYDTAPPLPHTSAWRVRARNTLTFTYVLSVINTLTLLRGARTRRFITALTTALRRSLS